jgi:hypothetical protein
MQPWLHGETSPFLDNSKRLSSHNSVRTMVYALQAHAAQPHYSHLCYSNDLSTLLPTKHPDNVETQTFSNEDEQHIDTHELTMYCLMCSSPKHLMKAFPQRWTFCLKSAADCPSFKTNPVRYGTTFSNAIYM